jgi:hypothetical protein
MRGTIPASWPPGFTPNPDYRFQMIVADYLYLHGHNFLMIADRFTGWNVIMSTPQGKTPGHYHEGLLCHMEHTGTHHHSRRITDDEWRFPEMNERLGHLA